MHLDELLALLPDNTTGEIDAADLRTIVTDLWTAAHSAVLRFAYQYSINPAPGAGELGATWAVGDGSLTVSETSEDGEVLPFSLIDGTTGVSFVVATPAGDRAIVGDITGPSVDQGTYRVLPTTVDTALLTEPPDKTLVTLTLTFTIDTP
jgi:hypothetical protein